MNYIGIAVVDERIELKQRIHHGHLLGVKLAPLLPLQY